MGHFLNFRAGGIPWLLLGSATGPCPSRKFLLHDSGTCQSACSANDEVQPKGKTSTAGLEPTTTRLRALRSAD
jgi:hypothetical protein